MASKIANVVECLSNYPQPKGAIITISNAPMAHHSSDSDAKCARELQLYLDEAGDLSGTVFLRAGRLPVSQEYPHARTDHE
jgi:hypothetical protein